MDIVQQITEAHYRDLEKNNENGVYDNQLKWFKAMQNLLKTFTTPSKPKSKHSKQEDAVLEIQKILATEFGKNYFLMLKNQKKLEIELEKHLEKTLNQSLKNLERKFNWYIGRKLINSRTHILFSLKKIMYEGGLKGMQKNKDKQNIITDSKELEKKIEQAITKSILKNIKGVKKAWKIAE